MTGSTQVLMAGGLPLTPFTVVLSDIKTGSAVTARVDLKADGSITVTGNGSSATPPNWALPINATNGDNYWVMAQLVSGTNPTTGTMLTRLALSGSPFWSWGRATVGSTVAQVKLDFFADGTTGPSLYNTTFNVTCTMN